MKSCIQICCATILLLLTIMSGMIPGPALVAVPTAQAQVRAFPGAEGFGANATGGRGGSVYIVTNLNDSGAGSFRDAVSQPNRYVVFAVGGIINIDARVVVSPNITIAGQTAPGDGITIYGNGLSFSNANNTITRYIRIRMGVGGDSGADAIAIATGNNMIFDHVSVSWGRDGTFDINGDVSNVTIQNCIIAQGLDTHSTGGLMQSTGGVSIIRTLWIDNHTRNPKVKGINQYINNVIYNWRGDGYILGDSAGISEANVIGNYFIDGPSSTGGAFTRGNTNFHIYAANNFRDRNRNGSLDGALIPQNEYTTVTWMASPFPYPAVATTSPQQAFNDVLAKAGTSLRRDRIDTRLITELTSFGTLGQIISNENATPMNGPGPVNGGTAPADTDRDGMPNAWETANGTNPNVADPNGDVNGNGYRNIEDYANSLVTGGTSFQAESAAVSGGAVTESTNGGFMGTSYVNFPAAGGVLEFQNVSSGAGGDRTLQFRYALGVTGSRSGLLVVNGAARSITFNPTGSWTTWNNLEVTVPLNSGSNTIRLESNGQDLANIDQLILP
ncbi:MAG TPA: carbohydrate-binding protein [Blastocatellia bacterium]|nr:carbohydrate-binding protein [Blastocatellia bacterium]